MQDRKTAADRGAARRQGDAPLTARSVLASTLLGADPPELPVAHLVRVASLFGINGNRARVALSRMVASGEATTDGAGRYRLTGALLARQQRQAQSRAGRMRRWRGDWMVAVVAAEAGRAAPRGARHRASLRAARLAELREGVWMRPDNLAVDPDALQAEFGADLHRFVSRPAGDPAALAAQLWDLPAWSQRAGDLQAGLDALPPDVPEDLAPGFVLSASVLRHLQADPLLPPELLPPMWPGGPLRARYEEWDARYRRTLARWAARPAALTRRSRDPRLEYDHEHMFPSRWDEGLDDAQLAAVTHGDGPLVVVAGAGTGKTRTLTARVAHLIERGVAPERILLLTFTRRAADDMLARAAATSGHPGVARRLRGGTFHAVAHRLLSAHGEPLGLSAGFSLLDPADAAVVMDLLRDEHGLGGAEVRAPRPATLVDIYSRCVNTNRPLSEVLAVDYPWSEPDADALAALCQAYVARKRAHGQLDFDDLLLYWRARWSTGASGRSSRASSTTCWWTSTRIRTPCRSTSCAGCAPRVGASPSSATTRRRCTGSAGPTPVTCTSWRRRCRTPR